MSVHMPMLHPHKTSRDQTSQKSSQHPYPQSLAIALVGRARKSFISSDVVTASNSWIRRSPNCTILAPRPLRCNLHQLRRPNQQRSSRWDPLGSSYASTAWRLVLWRSASTANFHGSNRWRRRVFPSTQKTSMAPHKNAAGPPHSTINHPLPCWWWRSHAFVLGQACWWYKRLFPSEYYITINPTKTQQYAIWWEHKWVFNTKLCREVEDKVHLDHLTLLGYEDRHAKLWSATTLSPYFRSIQLIHRQLQNALRTLRVNNIQQKTLGLSSLNNTKEIDMLFTVKFYLVIKYLHVYGRQYLPYCYYIIDRDGCHIPPKTQPVPNQPPWNLAHI